jgi:hypothetical protein
MPRKPTGRPPGAPPNNRNRLLHGLYSHHMSIQVEQEVDAMPADRNTHELALARARLAFAMDRQHDAPPELELAWERVIAYNIRTIGMLTHRNAVLGRDSRTSFVTVLEMIRQTNEQQKTR